MKKDYSIILPMLELILNPYFILVSTFGAVLDMVTDRCALLIGHLSWLCFFYTYLAVNMLLFPFPSSYWMMCFIQDKHSLFVGHAVPSV